MVVRAQAIHAAVTEALVLQETVAVILSVQDQAMDAVLAARERVLLVANVATRPDARPPEAVAVVQHTARGVRLAAVGKVVQVPEPRAVGTTNVMLATNVVEMVLVVHLLMEVAAVMEVVQLEGHVVAGKNHSSSGKHTHP